ncbi:ankyrin repeat domain-containing protein [Blastopirellula sp. JC732]|uniref:Ankyrin repeat domain-containing protein n=1 Tax=Blastopirellula sediminis TaxID=2894196 RepID=A0A9X1SL90_9BACT|nr:ankyrin repeat domain-containing protein [Blastopirellula sediminis]MCC9606268.1 ankyrin repeat domain-containing protein [Blastopirellula sediminis]MCC9630434.1 ankyrin repeat domain-containing protein [Blastopirellula sediminis]
MIDKTANQALARAIYAQDPQRVQEVIAANPSLVRDFVTTEDLKRSWLNLAVKDGNAAVVAAMLDAGYNINVQLIPTGDTPLQTAILFEKDETVELLIARGANPNLDRSLVSALNWKLSPERRLRYVTLLVEAGADLNRLYNLYDDPGCRLAAIDWTDDPAVIDLLRSHGAKTAYELEAEREEV